MSDEPTDQQTTEEVDIDALAGDKSLGDRIRLEDPADSPAPPPASSMDTLPIDDDAARMRLQEDDPASEPSPYARPKRSTLDAITRTRDKSLQLGDEDEDDPDDPPPPRTAMERLFAEWTRMMLKRGVPASSIETLLALFGDRIDLRPTDERPDGPVGGDVSTSDDATSRVPLRDGAEEPTPLALLESLMRFSERMPLREDATDSGSGGVSMEVPLHTDGRLALRSRPEPDKPEPPGAGDPFAVLDSSVRMSLREGPAEDKDAPESTMGDLFKLIEAPDRSQPPEPSSRSSMGKVFDAEPGRRFPLFEEERPRSMADDLSTLLKGAAAPRLELPKRTSRRQAPPRPDGVTPLPPVREVVYGELDPRQRCPKKGSTPREIGEAVHERLDFRYNRFRRLEIRRPLFECPGCPDVETFSGGKPAYLCTEAPIGEGLLAMVVVSRYFDRLPLDRLRTLLEQLGAPIPAEVLLNELDRASEAIAPIVALMRKGAKAEEAPLPALVTGTLRDTPGAVHVHTGGGHVVFSFAEGDARKTDANRERGPIALQRWRGQGGRGRWAQTRQRFFLALLTDPEKARVGLHAISKLPPEPPADDNVLRPLKRWLDDEYQTFGAPRDRLQHAVTATLAMWGFLSKPEKGDRVHASDTWVFESPDGDVHAALRWLSLTESCAGLGVQPWEYLHQLLRALAANTDLDAKQWTPQAFQRRS